MPKISLDAAGLVALADLTTIARQTALAGTSVLFDALVLCPGLHRQQAADELNGAEYPAVAAMTTGYVFRVENSATVAFLQKVGRTGQLTNLTVSELSTRRGRLGSLLGLFYSYENASTVSIMAYFTIVVMTMMALVLVSLSDNLWGLAVLVMLIFARLCNIVVIRRRNVSGWKGASEPGVKGDLLVLLSRDRWIRIRGLVDDLKAVTSGEWLRDMTFLESSVTAFATVLVYVDAALASNMDQLGKFLLMVLLISSAGLLAIVNESTESQQMHGRLVKVDGERKAYDRRLTMANHLVKESGRNDWAIRLGMIVSDGDPKAEEPPPPEDEVVIM